MVTKQESIEYLMELYLELGRDCETSSILFPKKSQGYIPKKHIAERRAEILQALLFLLSQD